MFVTVINISHEHDRPQRSELLLHSLSWERNSHCKNSTWVKSRVVREQPEIFQLRMYKQGQFHPPGDGGTRFYSGFNAWHQCIWKYTCVEASTFLHIFFLFQSFDWKYTVSGMKSLSNAESLGFDWRNSFHCCLKIPTCFLPEIHQYLFS